MVRSPRWLAVVAGILVLGSGSRSHAQLPPVGSETFVDDCLMRFDGAVYQPLPFCRLVLGSTVWEMFSDRFRQQPLGVLDLSTLGWVYFFDYGTQQWMAFPHRQSIYFFDPKEIKVFSKSESEKMNKLRALADLVARMKAQGNQGPSLDYEEARKKNDQRQAEQINNAQNVHPYRTLSEAGRIYVPPSE
jgi:hypothetical protein